MRILEELRKKDVFGQEQKFNINKGQKFQTPIGGCLFFFYVIIFLLRFYWGAYKYILKNDPEVNISDSFFNAPIYFKPKDKIISLRGLDHTKMGFYNKTYDLEEYFDFSAFNLYETKTGDNPKIELNIKKCEENETYITNTHYEDNICIYAPDDKFIPIYGGWSDNMSYIHIVLKFCDPKLKKKCKGENEFWRFLNRTKEMNYIETRIVNELFNPENYTNPLQGYEENYYKINSRKLSNTFTFNFKANQVNSDIGGIFNYVEYKTGREMESVNRVFDYIENFGFDRSYFKVIIKSREIKKIYSRIYPFINTWIEEATLFSTWITIFLNFFYSFYNDYKYKWFIFKTLVKYEDENENDDNDNGKDKYTIKAIDLIEIENENKRKTIIENKNKNKNENNNNTFNSFEENYNNNLSKKFFSKKNILNKKDLEINNELKEIENENNNEINIIQEDKNNSNLFFNPYEKKNIAREILKKVEKEKKEKSTISVNEKEKNETESKLKISSHIIFESLTKSNKKNYINYFYWINRSRVNKQKKKIFDFFEKVYEKIEEKFDIFYYLRKIRNLEILKKILFEEKTEKLLDFYSNKLYSFINIDKKTNNEISSADELLELIKSIDNNYEINNKLIKEIMK
jgi:hypothetical protein